MGGYKTCLKKVVSTAKPVAPVTVENGAKVAKVPADEVLVSWSWESRAAVRLWNEWPTSWKFLHISPFPSSRRSTD